MCLTNGKHALVEKAFTVNAAQAKELIRLSEEKHLLLADAFWTRYLPAREMIDDILRKGLIGEITSVMADFGLQLEHTERLTEPALAGGALLDLAVYPLNFALMFCKSPIRQVLSTAVLSEKGVDLANSITLTFEDGVMAVLHSNMRSLLRREGVIFGKKGRIVVRGINCVQDITVYDLNDQVIDYRKAPDCITNYQYEILDCIEAFAQGKTECDKMPHSETLRMMELLDLIRAQWGMKFSCE
jgi:predicted dehydrogenase